MPEETSIEIDTKLDWQLAEFLHLKQNRIISNKVKLVMSDLDGVLTDGGVYCNQNEEFLKKAPPVVVEKFEKKMKQKLSLKNKILTQIKS